MPQASHPTKEQVRQYMQQRQEEHRPPPTPEQIKRELGWHLVEAERKGARNA